MIIVFMLDGELLYRCQNMEFLISASEAFIIPAGENYEFETNATKQYHKLVLEVRGSLIPVLSSKLKLDFPVKLNSDMTEGLEKELREFEHLLSAPSSSDHLDALGQVYRLVTKLTPHNGKGSEKKLHPLVEKAQLKLENEMSSPLNMSELAKDLGTCKSMLNQQFRSDTGYSPLQYQIQIKMNEAQRLLNYTNLRIKEIAYRVGYKNQLYFSNAFRKYYGISPRKFREKN